MSSRKATRPVTTEDPGLEIEMSGIPRRPGSRGRGTMTSPPLTHVDNKAGNMMFPSSAANSQSASSSSLIQSRGPPVPPKEDIHQASPTKKWDRKKHGKGIRVQKEWDVERGISEESDRQPLDPRRDYSSRW